MSRYGRHGAPGSRGGSAVADREARSGGRASIDAVVVTRAVTQAGAILPERPMTPPVSWSPPIHVGVGLTWA